MTPSETLPAVTSRRPSPSPLASPPHRGPEADEVLLLLSRAEVHVIVVVPKAAVGVVPAVLPSVGRDAAVAAAGGARAAPGAAAVAAAAEPAGAAPAPLGAAGEERHEYAVDRLVVSARVGSTVSKGVNTTTLRARRKRGAAGMRSIMR